MITQNYALIQQTLYARSIQYLHPNNHFSLQYEGGVLEMFLTESQKHYYTAMKKLGRKKPQKVIKRPINQFLAMFYDLSNSRRFEIAIFVLIFLNMLTMGIEHYNQPHAIYFVLEVSNAFFTTVFGLGKYIECKKIDATVLNIMSVQ